MPSATRIALRAANGGLLSPAMSHLGYEGHHHAAHHRAEHANHGILVKEALSNRQRHLLVFGLPSRMLWAGRSRALQTLGTRNGTSSRVPTESICDVTMGWRSDYDVTHAWPQSNPLITPNNRFKFKFTSTDNIMQCTQNNQFKSLSTLSWSIAPWSVAFKHVLVVLDQ